MSKTAIILAGGVSRRFGQDKGLISLAGKPLVMHVFEKACLVAEELIVVVGSAVTRAKDPGKEAARIRRRFEEIRRRHPTHRASPQA